MGLELIGYVQATVRADGSATIAYQLAGAYWGRGLARQAVVAMIAELAEHYQTQELWAVLKRENHRSMRLLERLGFSMAMPAQVAEHQVEPDEALMRNLIKNG